MSFGSWNNPPSAHGYAYRFVYILIAILLLGSGGCTSFQKMLMIAGDDPVSPEERAAAIAAGARLYTEHCIACHGQDGDGVEDLATRDDGTRVILQDLAAQKAVNTFAANIYYGKGTRMLAYGPRLPEEQIWQLAHYVKSLARADRTN